MVKQIYFITFLMCLLMPFSAYARCAVCYTNGLSGASIAVIVIVLSAILLFVSNIFLQKFLERYK
tara:strand:- start:453 stop:647 length:195 start_codon:yes stop_codon:yes gene_type:complete